jgi:hypothetical protein
MTLPPLTTILVRALGYLLLACLIPLFLLSIIFAAGTVGVRWMWSGGWEGAWEGARRRGWAEESAQDDAAESEQNTSASEDND